MSQKLQDSHHGYRGFALVGRRECWPRSAAAAAIAAEQAAAALSHGHGPGRGHLYGGATQVREARRRAHRRQGPDRALLLQPAGRRAPARGRREARHHRHGARRRDGLRHLRPPVHAVPVPRPRSRAQGPQRPDRRQVGRRLLQADRHSRARALRADAAPVPDREAGDPHAGRLQGDEAARAGDSGRGRGREGARCEPGGDRVSGAVHGAPAGHRRRLGSARRQHVRLQVLRDRQAFERRQLDVQLQRAPHQRRALAEDDARDAEDRQGHLEGSRDRDFQQDRGRGEEDDRGDEEQGRRRCSIPTRRRSARRRRTSGRISRPRCGVRASTSKSKRRSSGSDRGASRAGTHDRCPCPCPVSEGHGQMRRGRSGDGALAMACSSSAPATMCWRT